MKKRDLIESLGGGGGGGGGGGVKVFKVRAPGKYIRYLSRTKFVDGVHPTSSCSRDCNVEGVPDWRRRGLRIPP